MINAIILIIHEIDSGYWEEWKLISPDDKNGINGFLLGHIPLLFIILFGLVLVYDNKPAGIIFSFLLSGGGLFAFIFHFYHLRKGRPEFNTLLSKTLIISTFVISIVQIIATIIKI